MIQKLKEQKGEMLVESLISMLIVVLSVGFLASCVMAATNINKQTSAMDEEYHAQLQAAEGRLTEYADILDPKISITFHSEDRVNELGSNRSEKWVDVTVYGGEQFISYEQKE